MSNHITIHQLENLRGKLQATGIIGVERLVNIYEEQHQKLLDQATYPMDEKQANRLLINQSIINWLNTIILLNNTRAGRKALQQIGITIATTDAKREQFRQRL